MNLFEIRYFGAKLQLTEYELYRFKGKDALTFTQNAGTNDFQNLNINEACLNTRLDHAGKIQFFFYSAKKENEVIFLLPKEVAQSAVENLEKYIIMEEIEIEKIDFNPLLVLSPFVKEISEHSESNDFFLTTFYGEAALVIWNQDTLFESLNLPLLSNYEEGLKQLKTLSAWPQWSQNINQRIVNETILDQYAVSYSKGCFLGQETVAKIHYNRGAAYYPQLVELEETPAYLEDFIDLEFNCESRKGGRVLDICDYDGKSYLLVELFREFRIKGFQLAMKFPGQNLRGIVRGIPFFEDSSRSEKAHRLFEFAIGHFQKDELERASELLEHAIELDQTYADAYESLGVIKGKMGQYDEALGLMDKLLKVDPNSIMAHTNKSRFYMQMGRIEEAETEKSLATTKSFAKTDHSANANDLQLKEMKAREEAMLKREEMFLQVLEIDDEDALANMGMGEICFHRKNYTKSIEYTQKVLRSESENTLAYLVLGKSYEATGKINEAKEVYDKGFKIASRKGQQAHADEIYTRLNAL